MIKKCWHNEEDICPLIPQFEDEIARFEQLYKDAGMEMSVLQSQLATSEQERKSLSTELLHTSNVLRERDEKLKVTDVEVTYWKDRADRAVKEYYSRKSEEAELRQRAEAAEARLKEAAKMFKMDDWD